MKLQLVSDLHLDINKKSVADFDAILKPSADILAILGDTCDSVCPLFKEFLSYCSQNFKTVILLA